MTVQFNALCVDVSDPGRQAEFWAGLLGRDIVDEPRGMMLPGFETQVGLRMVYGQQAKAGTNRIHLHVTSTSPADQQDIVARARELGGRHIDIGQLPEEGHIVLADPEGNVFCVIEPGNNFLAGCGFLGEVACDGTRAVGLFWAEMLGWPLVWDKDQETAIQSPSGGTKIAWGGPPLAPKRGRNRQRFELVVDGDMAGEIDRMTTLGAILASSNVLADPDGNEFMVIHRDENLTGRASSWA